MVAALAYVKSLLPSSTILKFSLLIPQTSPSLISSSWRSSKQQLFALIVKSLAYNSIVSLPFDSICLTFVLPLFKFCRNEGGLFINKLRHVFHKHKHKESSLSMASGPSHLIRVCAGVQPWLSVYAATIEKKSHILIQLSTIFVSVTGIFKI